MIQLVYTDKFFISGTPEEVIQQLRMLSEQYHTVKEFLQSKTADL